VTGRTYRDRVRQDVSGGIRSGVNGTPTFFINGQRHNGPQDFDTLSRVIQERL
jgi:protein-disulfide isomerase